MQNWEKKDFGALKKHVDEWVNNAIWIVNLSPFR